MSRQGRLGWRILFWGLLLPVLVLLYLPLTERGSKLVLDNVGQLLPVEIEYGSGTIAGELALSRLAWRSDTVKLELLGLVLEISPVCLWHSKVCFEQLYARQLDIFLLPGAPESVMPVAGDDALVEFPVALETANLQLDGLLVQWEGGEWRQGSIEGAARISGSTIRVRRALVQGAILTLSGGDDAGEQLLLPDIKLPLELVVEQAVLLGVAWDLSGAKGELDSLRLRGGWLENNIRLEELQVRSGALGQWGAAGDIEFAGQWPLAVSVEGVVPALPGWPAVLERGLTLEAGGDLANLAVRSELGGPLRLTVDGSLNTLLPDLPFQLEARVDWPGTLTLPELAEVPGPLASVIFTAPVQLAMNGTLGAQVFQIEAAAEGLGYEAMAIRVAGTHRAGRLVLEDLRLQDASGNNTLWGRGELEYEAQPQWSALLESSGIDLLPLAEFGTGRVEGQLRLMGEFAGDEWSVSLDEADMDGTFNGLPVRLTGYAGVNSQLRLLTSELDAQVNGTNVLLSAPADLSRPVLLDITMEELGRWLPDGRGSVSLQLSLTRGWEHFTATGSALGLEWQTLQVASGKIAGNYYPGAKGKFDLALNLVDIEFADFDLETARLLASGNSSAQEISLSTRGDANGLLEINGTAGAGGSWAGQLAATTVQTREGNWYLGEPVALEFSPAPARLKLAAHCWQYQQTNVCPGEALLGETGHASLALEGDLSAFAALLPDHLELAGKATGEFAAAWAPGQSVTLDGDAMGRDIRFTRQFGGGESGTVSWQKIEAEVHNSSRGLSLRSGVYTDDLHVIDLDLRLPSESSQPLAGTLVIDGLQLASLAAFAPTMSVLAGEVSGSLQLRGTVKKPMAEGVIQLSGGHFVALGNPTELRELELQLDALGDRFAVQGQGMLGGGELAVSGHLLSRPEWRLELAIEGDRQEILLPPYTQMLVSEKLDITLSDGLLDLKGNVVVHEGELEHEQLPAGGVTLSDDVVEVDLGGNVIYKRAPFDIGVRVGLLIEDKFKILGDMVNATLGGDLQLRQEPRQPLQVFGNLNVIGGVLRAYQQRLRIERGTISFSGTPQNPELDVRAQREISSENIVVGLELKGTLKQPKIEVFSDPVMSHGEAMSYLVRGRGVDSGADADGVAMALSLGTGLVNQTALVTELNRIPGINNLSFGAEGSTEEDTAATVGGYIGERIYLSYGMGIYEPINVLTARLYLQTRLWLEVVSRLENSVDLYYSFDIK